MPLSARNPKVQRLRRLVRRRKDRAAEGAFVLEGPNVVDAALTAGAALEAVFSETGADERLIDRARSAGVPVHDLAEGTLAKVTDAVTPQPVAAIAAQCDVPLADAIAAAVDRQAPIVHLVDVQDPGNVGTLVRTAEASGAAAVVLSGASADVFGPKAVRASAGSLFHVAIAVEPDPSAVLDALRAADVPAVATDVAGPTSVHDADLTGAVALVFGNEADGLSDDLLEAVTAVIAVPIAGHAESLNVAAAGAVVCFEARRQRSDGRSEAMEVVSTVSHELRSPLTSIQGYTSLLLNRWDRIDDEQKRSLLEGMQADAGRVGRLVGELLDVSRLETGRLSLRRQQVDLPGIVSAAIERVGLAHPHLDVTVEMPSDLPRVRADPDKIQQVLLNLLENAAKYAGPGPVRVVGERSDPTQVAVSVIDQGEGIPADDLDRVFTKFYRREDQRPSGIGLGLWISRGLVEAHGGTLTATAKMGAGSTFCLTLPV